MILIKRFIDWRRRGRERDLKEKLAVLEKEIEVYERLLRGYHHTFERQRLVAAICEKAEVDFELKKLAEQSRP